MFPIIWKISHLKSLTSIRNIVLAKHRANANRNIFQRLTINSSFIGLDLLVRSKCRLFAFLLLCPSGHLSNTGMIGGVPATPKKRFFVLNVDIRRLRQNRRYINICNKVISKTNCSLFHANYKMLSMLRPASGDLFHMNAKPIHSKV